MTRTATLGGLDLGPAIILGGNVFGWTTDRDESFAVLDAFVAGGGRMIDTADRYSAWVPGHQGGESETIIGEWLAARGKRDRVLIATKVGLEMGDGTAGLEPARIARQVEDSLRRLRTDYIDLYIAHRDDPAVPQDAVADAFERLVQAGKVRIIGASNFNADRLDSAIAAQRRLGNTPYRSLQNLYNLLERDGYEGAVQRFCVENDIAMTPFYGLASGYLTGKYRTDADFEGKARGSAARAYHNGKGPRVLAALDGVAGETGAVPAQIALAWLIARPGVAAPIASATSPAQVEQLIAATAVALTPDQIARLDQASA